MIPDRTLSSTPISAPFLPPDGGSSSPLIDYEMGGVALRDASEGLQVQVWTFFLDGTNVRVSAPSVAATTLFTRTGITELSGCFDQNMNPCVVFVQAGTTVLYWFDSLAGMQVFTTFGAYENPKVSMDDKRTGQNANNDIIFAYLRERALYFRAQRDRFSIETMLFPLISDKYVFKAMGMSSINRFQFLFVPAADA